MAVALEYERAASLARRGELVEAQAREVVNSILKWAGAEDVIRAPSIRAHFTDWLATKTKKSANGTGLRYAVIVERFLGSLKHRAEKPLTALHARDIERFIESRLSEGLAPQTVALNGKVVRTALNAARRQGLIATNPAEAVDLPEGEAMERGTFTPQEVKMLVEAAKGEWKTLILVAYFTGARLSDCCRIGWEGVDLAVGTLTYTQAKTGHKLTVPLHADLQAHLEGLAGNDKPQVFVMPHMASLKPGGRHGLSEGFKRVMKAAGLDTQTQEGNGLRRVSKRTFHALRHSFTSALANAGVAPEVRMKLTGHKSAAIHRGYTHHEMQTLKNAVAALPGLTK